MATMNIFPFEISLLASLLCVCQSFAADVGPSLQDNTDDFKKFKDKSCRPNRGKGSQRAGDFELFTRISRKNCKSKCLLIREACFGYEYSSPHNGKRCKVWKVPIDKTRLKYVHGARCYIRELTTPFPTPSPTTPAPTLPPYSPEDTPYPTFGFGTTSPAPTAQGTVYANSDTSIPAPTLPPGTTHYPEGTPYPTFGFAITSPAPITPGEPAVPGVAPTGNTTAKRCCKAKCFGLPQWSSLANAKEFCEEYHININNCPKCPPKNQPPSFEPFENHGCRTSNGGKGSEKTGEFDKSKVADRETCERECLKLGGDCFGYEYSSRFGRCEVWKVEISEIKLADVNGFDCYIKRAQDLDLEEWSSPHLEFPDMMVIL